MKIITILPVSREQYLDRILDSLMSQTYKPNNLLVIYDGVDKDFLAVRNKVVGLELDNILCIKSNSNRPAISIFDRRKHIVDLHNQFREYIVDADWIFSIEDDGILPPNALWRLVQVVNSKDDVGMVTGVELGRWGVPYVGAWTVDDIHDTKRVSSVENKTVNIPPTIDEIDACGLYGALIRASSYKQHEFFTHNGLGPDINLGLFLRQQGFTNYIDWGVPITHLTSNHGFEIEIPATSVARSVTLTRLSETTWQARR